MCTVSFYRDQNKVVLTSNRDEDINRPSAIPPKRAMVDGKELFYPKDALAGGTWFTATANGDSLILLNGAAIGHKHNPPYRKSRGLILLELAAGATELAAKWESIDLNGIEPFTVVAFTNNQLAQLRWNGNDKEWVNKSNSAPNIWSSSTLYKPEVVINRVTWYSDFLETKNQALSAEDLIAFHTQTKSQDQYNGLVINRGGKVLTKNVTQFILEGNRFTITHFDTLANTKDTLTHTIDETLVA